MLNEYIFDYRLVLEEDPSFEKFVDVINSENRDIEEYNYDINKKPDDVDQKENDIIDFVHSESDDKDLSENAYMNASNFRTNNQNDMKEVELKHEYVDMPNPNYNTSILQLPPPNRFLLPGSKAWQGEYTFYTFSRAQSGNFVCFMSKCRFSSKDHFIRLQKTVYRFDRKLNVTSEMKKFFSILTYNTKTKQLYLVKKQKNNSLRKKSHFHTIVRKVFNRIINTNWNGSVPKRISNKFLQEVLKAARKDVPDLVLIYKESSKSCLNGDDINYEGDVYNIKISNTVRDILRDTTLQTMNLVAIILQHRVGKPIKWLNYELLQNIYRVLGDKEFQEMCNYGTYSFYNTNRLDKEKKILALKRKTIFKLVPNLKKNNHMNETIRTIIGEHCNKFIIKLFNITNVDIQFLYTWIYATHIGLVSKNLYHFMSNAVNTCVTKQEITNLTNNISSMLSAIIHKYSQSKSDDGDGIFDKSKYYVIIDSYIRICKKLKKNDQQFSDNILWHTWYDMYNMASQLNIRIRPNKFKSGSDIQSIHNKLSDITRRDMRIIREYKNSVFDEFKSPDKKYDGFEFIQMRTADDLIEEGTIMKHCVASYANKCAKGESIIFSMRKDGKHYVTTELSPINYQIVQQYTIHDYTVTNQTVLDIIDEWNKDCIEIHKDDEESHYDMCQKKVKAFLNKERDKSLKELIKDSIVDSELQILKNEQQHEEEEILNVATI